VVPGAIARWYLQLDDPHGPLLKELPVVRLVVHGHDRPVDGLVIALGYFGLSEGAARQGKAEKTQNTTPDPAYGDTNASERFCRHLTTPR